MKIAILDGGSGNLGSALKAFVHLGADAALCADPAELALAERIVIPGQGHFGDVMEGLQTRGLVEPVRAAAKSGKPIFGICIGLQLFFEKSAEAPGVQGLGLLKGEVQLFSGACFGAVGGLKVPHMGWNTLQLARPHPVFNGLDHTHVYFVHSYFVNPARHADVLATCAYGQSFCAAAGQNNLVGCQFHPEKSQTAGLRILRNFLDWTP